MLATLKRHVVSFATGIALFSSFGQLSETVVAYVLGAWVALARREKSGQRKIRQHTEREAGTDL